MASDKDDRFPKKVVIAAMHYRGGNVVVTDNNNYRYGENAPDRENWTTIQSFVPYPDEIEE